MMLKLIRNRAGLVLAGLIAALCPMFMAPSGGFPSRPVFQSVTAPAANLTQITTNPGATAATSFINPQTDATLYSMLGRNQAGPGIQARWDSATSNRYLAFGSYDNAGAWTETFRTQNGNIGQATDGITFQGGGSAGTSTQFLISDTGTTESVFHASSTAGDICLSANGRAGSANCGMPAGTVGVQSTVALDLRGSSIKTNGVDITATAGTFTLTVATGCTTTPTSTATYSKIGATVTIHTGSGITCTSNAVGFTATGLPAALQSASVIGSIPMSGCNNNSVAGTGNCYVVVTPGSGSLTFGLNGSAGGWTASGTKSVTGDFTYTTQ